MVCLVLADQTSSRWLYDL